MFIYIIIKCVHGDIRNSVFYSHHQYIDDCSNQIRLICTAKAGKLCTNTRDYY